MSQFHVNVAAASFPSLLLFLLLSLSVGLRLHFGLISLFEDKRLREQHPWWADHSYHKHQFTPERLIRDEFNFSVGVLYLTKIKEHVDHNSDNTWSPANFIDAIVICEPLTNYKIVHEPKKRQQQEELWNEFVIKVQHIFEVEGIKTLDADSCCHLDDAENY